ncbi:hypothetical protein SLE2022_013170 [Rubroshorea leprosula]
MVIDVKGQTRQTMSHACTFTREIAYPGEEIDCGTAGGGTWCQVMVGSCRGLRWTGGGGSSRACWWLSSRLTCKSIFFNWLEFLGALSPLLRLVKASPTTFDVLVEP